MTTSEWLEFVEFTSQILWLFVSWMSGVLLGYMVGRIHGGD